MKTLILLLITVFSLSSEVSPQTSQNRKLYDLSQNVSELNLKTVQENQEIKDAKAKIVNLENEIFWLALLAALGFILPLPLGVYHIYRTRELLTQMADLEAKFSQQGKKASQVEAFVARNEKLENEIKEMQERFRTTMKNTQEKYQSTIEKMKDDMHLLDLENKRISGILMLKEQVVKKSSPGT